MWSGSEILVLELCESLRRRGAEVVVYANHWGQTLWDRFREIGAETTDDPSAIRLFDFDFVWIQHHTGALFDLTIDERSCPSTKVVFAHLSPYEPLESPGFVLESTIADLSLCNSEETRDTLLDSRLERDDTRLFPNPAPDAFFEHARTEWASRLRNVVVVSNHRPDELAAALTILRTEHGVTSDVFGVDGGIFERITPEILARYDAIITIGKTVQYGLASRIPVFCYDRFGGPGYLSDESFDCARRFNFSGRCTNRTLEAAVIAAELVRGFPAAAAWAARFDAEPFRLEHAIDRLLELSARPSEAKRLAIAEARDDIVRERRIATALRSSFRNQMYYQARMTQTEVEVAMKDAELAQKAASIAAIEGELERANASLASLDRTVDQLGGDVAHLRQSLDEARGQWANPFLSLKGRPAVVVRRLARVVGARVAAVTSRAR